MTQSYLLKELTDETDVMVNNWPKFDEDSSRRWPSYVKDEEPSIYGRRMSTCSPSPGNRKLDWPN